MRRILRVLVKVKNKAIFLIRWLFSSHGLLVILLSGIAVSLIASRAEDTVRRQRYLELLEYEIRTHLSLAHYLPENYGDSNDFNKHYIPSKFYQAILNSGYLTTIDPQLFLEITTYYELVNLANQRLERHYEYFDQLNNNWVLCRYTAFNPKELSLCDKHKEILDKATKYIPDREKNIWIGTVSWIQNYHIDERFHPTHDRLNSPILRILMGNEALLEFKND